MEGKKKKKREKPLEEESMKSWLDTSVKGLQESEPNRFPIKGGERNKGE